MYQHKLIPASNGTDTMNNFFFILLIYLSLDPKYLRFFGAFRKRCEKEVQVRPCLPPPISLDTSNRIKVNDNLPDLSDLVLPPLNRDQRSAFPFIGGTGTGIKRLDQYFWKSKKLSFYKKTRNGLLGVDYSSKFSPWLANGSISPKTIYWEIKRFEKEIQKNQSTYWLVLS